MTPGLLFDALRHDDDITIPAGWTQGRANYGGLVAALLYARMAGVLGGPRALRSATVSFIGPVATGPATVTARVLREGKSVVQMEAHLLQDGQVMAAMLASFGTARESALAVDEAPAPVFPAPDACVAWPQIPGVTPEFAQHFDFRQAVGGAPFTGADKGEMGGWMRLRDAREGLDYADLFLIIDAWPPAVLPMVRGLAAGSTLCWTLEPVQLPAGKSGGHWWQYLATTDYFHDGYGHCGARIWDDEGRLVAISRQTVVVFA